MENLNESLSKTNLKAGPEQVIPIQPPKKFLFIILNQLEANDFDHNNNDFGDERGNTIHCNLENPTINTPILESYIFIILYLHNLYISNIDNTIVLSVQLD